MPSFSTPNSLEASLSYRDECQSLNLRHLVEGHPCFSGGGDV